MARVIFNDVQIKYNLASISRNRLLPSLRGRNLDVDEKIALNSINLDIIEGQFVGLLGHNGSGKTTFLKTIAGILRPTSGKISISGSVGSLFSNIPFINPNLSPRENIVQYGEYNDLDASRIKSLTEELEEFTELGEYFNQPLVFGSSGMRTRFQFGLLTSVQYDILVVDEGIGAGDQYFVKKAEKRLQDLYSRASILVLASHSMDLIETFCNRGLVMENGAIIFDGDSESAVSTYTGRHNR